MLHVSSFLEWDLSDDDVAACRVSLVWILGHESQFAALHVRHYSVLCPFLPHLRPLDLEFWMPIFLDLCG